MRMVLKTMFAPTCRVPAHASLLCVGCFSECHVCVLVCSLADQAAGDMLEVNHASIAG